MLPDPSTVPSIQPEAVASAGATVIDVRTPEAFSECHIPESANHCVYEVSFMQSVPEAYPDKTAAIIVYGDGAPGKADLAAVGRLRALGYESVSVLEGGLKQWKAAGLATEGTGPVESAPASGTFALDTERSKVRWVGRNLTNQHDGEVAVKSGAMEVNAEGQPVGGEVVVDMQQMTCRDIEDKSLAGYLIAHLQNADFFLAEKYPTASFKMESATPIEGASYGLPNYTVRGILNVRGQDLPLEVKALVEPVEGGYVFQSNFNFDRVALGACYGSGRLFERLGMHLVNDLVTIDVTAFFTTQN
jgi:rhodanese-related sulfurtransferase